MRGVRGVRVRGVRVRLARVRVSARVREHVRVRMRVRNSLLHAAHTPQQSQRHIDTGGATVYNWVHIYAPTKHAQVA